MQIVTGEECFLAEQTEGWHDATERMLLSREERFVVQQNRLELSAIASLVCGESICDPELI